MPPPELPRKPRLLPRLPPQKVPDTKPEPESQSKSRGRWDKSDEAKAQLLRELQHLPIMEDAGSLQDEHEIIRPPYLFANWWKNFQILQVRKRGELVNKPEICLYCRQRITLFSDVQRAYFLSGAFKTFYCNGYKGVPVEALLQYLGLRTRISFFNDIEWLETILNHNIAAIKMVPPITKMVPEPGKIQVYYNSQSNPSRREKRAFYEDEVQYSTTLNLDPGHPFSTKEYQPTFDIVFLSYSQIPGDYADDRGAVSRDSFILLGAHTACLDLVPRNRDQQLVINRHWRVVGFAHDWQMPNANLYGASYA